MRNERLQQLADVLMSHAGCNPRPAAIVIPAANSRIIGSTDLRTQRPQTREPHPRASRGSLWQRMSRRGSLFNLD